MGRWPDDLDFLMEVSVHDILLISRRLSMPTTSPARRFSDFADEARSEACRRFLDIRCRFFRGRGIPASYLIAFAAPILARFPLRADMPNTISLDSSS